MGLQINLIGSSDLKFDLKFCFIQINPHPLALVLFPHAACLRSAACSHLLLPNFDRCNPQISMPLHLANPTLIKRSVYHALTSSDCSSETYHSITSPPTSRTCCNPPLHHHSPSFSGSQVATSYPIPFPLLAPRPCRLCPFHPNLLLLRPPLSHNTSHLSRHLHLPHMTSHHTHSPLPTNYLACQATLSLRHPPPSSHRPSVLEPTRITRTHRLTLLQLTMPVQPTTYRPLSSNIPRPHFPTTTRRIA